ncbi:MAG TPA: dipeptide ABC transporter ATP-binding protein [Desulfobacterales bacterium]|nr:dipeptide ABC transporter ATP-binding protein [Desulfobacterales bacterium]
MPDPPESPEILLEARNIVKHFPIRGGVFMKPVGAVRAVDDVSLAIRKGETVGLVGESGCGKTTFGRVILRLEEPTAGALFFEGENLLAFGRARMRRMRREMQIIFQDPFSSLNPRNTVAQIIGEPLLIHGLGSRREREARVLELLETVGLRREQMRRYPHQFSGGQRQRIGVARALALQPKLIVCDEAVSALDVSIQAQVINLLEDLQERFGLTYLFISHDLGVVEHVSDRVAVMYLGQIVELAASETLYRRPLHPYTQALLSAVPMPDPTLRGERIILRGDVPSPIDPPPGCRFHTRCLFAKEVCRKRVPSFREVADGHWVACFFAGVVGIRGD